jgi:hypothetical protein
VRFEVKTDRRDIGRRVLKPAKVAAARRYGPGVAHERVELDLLPGKRWMTSATGWREIPAEQIDSSSVNEPI